MALREEQRGALDGVRVGRLTVVRRAGSDNGAVWLCACDCGVQVPRRASELRRRLKQNSSNASCGCVPANYRHGLNGSALDMAYENMIHRCYSENVDSYPRYGGRGIRVCDQWRADRRAFFAWANANGYAPGLEIDLENTNGNYTPENCRFVTRLVNHRNRRISRTLTWNGETRSLQEWADVLGINYHALYLQLKRGWSLERVFAGIEVAA